jgi:hypothetical protein
MMALAMLPPPIKAMWCEKEVMVPSLAGVFAQRSIGQLSLFVRAALS